MKNKMAPHQGAPVFRHDTQKNIFINIIISFFYVLIDGVITYIFEGRQ